MMNLVMISFVAALVSGWLAADFNEHRSVYLAVCVASSVMALASVIRLIPDAVWITFSPHIWGTILVASFWLLRTQVRKVLLKA